MTEQRAALTAEQVRELLDYNPETGRFTWRIAPRGHKAGSQAGCIDSYGYVVIRIAGAGHKAHRLAWLIAYGEWPDDQVDHINGDRSDNRIANLRDVSRLTNRQNMRRAQADNRSGLLGVSLTNNRCKASIRSGGKNHHLGYFASPEAAHAAYVAAKRQTHEGCTL